MPTRKLQGGTARHKKHFDKVMFLSAQARPRYDPHRKHCWDGKIAMIPIGDYVEAKRNSQNFKKGDPKWENAKCRHRALPADDGLCCPWNCQGLATRQWSDPNFTVIIKQDGAPAHKSTEFNEDGKRCCVSFGLKASFPALTRSVW